MKHISQEEKGQILRDHGWNQNVSGGWYRLGEDSDSGLSVYAAFEQLGHATEIQRDTLIEHGWTLGVDETWEHKALDIQVKMTGPMALAVQAKLEACLETAYQNTILQMAEKIGQHPEVIFMDQAKRGVKRK